MATSNTIYIITSTDGATFSIQPRTIDGADGVQRNSDITLYGNSTPSWGERFNENFFRLLENFAIEQESDGVPRGAATAGMDDSLGIHKPVEGQLWFNKTTQTMYVYTSSSSWSNFSDVVASGTTANIPAIPEDGQLYYDTDEQQLKVYDPLIGWKSVAEQYVRLDGSTMTDLLVLSGDPVVPLGAATKQYVDGVVGSAAHLQLSGGTMDSGANITMQGGGTVLGVSTPTNPTDAANKQYIDDAGYVELAGDLMTGALGIATAPTAFEPGTLIVVSQGDAQLQGPAIQMGLFDNALVSPLAGGIGAQVCAIELHTPDNNSLTGGHAGAKPIMRITNRPHNAFSVEADFDYLGGQAPGGNTSTIMEVTQTLFPGILTFNGTDWLGGGNYGTVFCPNATIANINANSKFLTTKEYVDAQMAATPTFIPRVTFVSTGGTLGWTTINVGGLVPVGTTNIILEAEWTMLGPDGGDVDAAMDIRATGSGNTYVLSGARAAGSGDNIGGANQGIFPMNGSRQFDVRITSPSFGGITGRVIGYIG